MCFEFERELNHYGCGLTGYELVDSPAHDEIIMIRCIEMNMNRIAEDPMVCSGVFDFDKLVYIYREYCSTTCEVTRDGCGEIVGFPNISLDLIRRCINLAVCHSIFNIF